MSEGAFFREQAKQQAKEAVEEIESHTSAEVVVALRKTCGHYRHADYLFGALAALGTLGAMLFLPWEFPLWSFVVDVVVAFALGAVVCATWPTLRRLLVWPPLRRRNAETAARAAFVDLGISRTTGRSGILVFVAMFERHVEVVADIGIDPAALEAGWGETLRDLRAAVGLSPDFPRFVAALRKLGPLLGGPYPRSADDVNELPDEVAS